MAEDDRATEIVRVVSCGGDRVHVSAPQQYAGTHWRSAGYLPTYRVADRDRPGADHQGGLGRVCAQRQGRHSAGQGQGVPGRWHDHALLVLRGASGAVESKHGTTGFCVQLVGLLDGTPIWISDPLPGNTHDKNAFDSTDTIDIIKKALAGIGDKGYQGANLFHPPRNPATANSARVKRRPTPHYPHSVHPSSGSWHTSRTGGYSTPTTAAPTPHTGTHSTRLAHCSSSRLSGVLNKAPYPPNWSWRET
jgi:DDE superfamily endonuclease